VGSINHLLAVIISIIPFIIFCLKNFPLAKFVHRPPSKRIENRHSALISGKILPVGRGIAASHPIHPVGRGTAASLSPKSHEKAAATLTSHRRQLPY
jgi:hypothetical protein